MAAVDYSKYTYRFGDEQFSKTYPYARTYEGGKDNDPKDPGGKTAYGVIQREYSSYRRNKGLPVRDVWSITEEEVAEIYHGYWINVKADKMAPGVSFWMFNKGLNTGPAQAAKFLQRGLAKAGLYKGSIDGQVGKQTLDALERHPDHDKLLADLSAQAEAFYRALKTFDHFGKGWLSRNRQELQIGQAWAMGSVGPEVEYQGGSLPAQPKAKIGDAKPLPSTGIADAASGVGGASTVAGLMDTVNAAKDTVAPLATNGGWIGNVFVGLTVAGIALTAGSLAYRSYAKRKSAKLVEALALSPVNPSTGVASALEPEEIAA